MLDAIVAHPVAQVAEIALDEGETLVGRDVGLGVGVLVEAEKASLGPKAREDFPTVSSSAEGDIHVCSGRIYVEAVDALL